MPKQTKTTQRDYSELEDLFKDIDHNEVANYINQSNDKGKPSKRANPVNTTVSGAPDIISDEIGSDYMSDEEAFARSGRNQNANAGRTDKKVEPKQSTEVAVQSKSLAKIQKDVSNLTGINPQFRVVSDLPGYLSSGIRKMGRSIFGMYTSTDLEDIEVLANVQGNGPNSDREINAVAKYAHNVGTIDQQMADNMIMDFERTIPGYEAELRIYTTPDRTFMLVKDFAGNYIYAWPTDDTIYVDRPNKALTFKEWLISPNKRLSILG